MLLSETLRFVVKIAAELIVFLCMMGVLLEWTMVSVRHPLVAVIHRMTQAFASPVLKCMRGLKRWQALFVAAFLTACVAALALISLAVVPYEWSHANFWLVIVVSGLLHVIKVTLQILLVVLLVQVVLSWIHPWNPIMPILQSLTRPLLAPFKRLIWNGIDFAPFVVFLLLQWILVLLIPSIELFFQGKLPLAF